MCHSCIETKSEFSGVTIQDLIHARNGDLLN